MRCSVTKSHLHLGCYPSDEVDRARWFKVRRRPNDHEAALVKWPWPRPPVSGVVPKPVLLHNFL